ncbi:hypothetical protein [Baaleninema simplex]|uniref:hypothetical protein n=1 Tax=Baaleninema simplex TaxID=2862350 RepID=UPI00038155AE|nr:hypothetical protein [Baaleninema simplex]
MESLSHLGFTGCCVLTSYKKQDERGAIARETTAPSLSAESVRDGDTGAIDTQNGEPRGRGDRRQTPPYWAKGRSTVTSTVTVAGRRSHKSPNANSGDRASAPQSML